LGPCAQALGYRGHCLTTSRRYSTTFKALREARQHYVHEQLLARSHDAAQRALAGATERTASFRYVGVGHLTAADWRARRVRWRSTREVNGEREGHDDRGCWRDAARQAR
jgi:hypothetical protein